MTARSVVLSLLLGASDDGLPVRDIVALGREFDIAPTSLRVALSRLVAAGELRARDATYRLSDRHRQRRLAQEADLAPTTLPYDGSWTQLVVTSSGREPAERSGLRRAMRERRLAELTGGVWMRPANLAVETPATSAEVVRLVVRPDDDVALATRLWDLDGWAREAERLLAAAALPASLRDRFVANAAIVRHLRTDPLLPPGLRPAGWPAGPLHDVYESFRAELTALHQHPTALEENSA